MSATVLIVNDDASLANQFQAGIEEVGLKSEWSTSADTARQAILSSRPDLILLDADLVLNDPALCGKLRRCCPTKYLPIILQIPQDSQDVSCYLCGTEADDYICQPYSKDELQSRMLLRLSGQHKKSVPAITTVDYSFLAGLSHLAVSELDTGVILQRIIEAISEVIEVRRCSITMVREDAEYGYVMASNDNPEVNGLRIDLSRYPEIQETLRTGRPLLIDDICRHPLMECVRPYIEKLDFNSILVLPMIDHQRVVGVLVLRTARLIVGFSEEEVSFCQLVANVATSALRLAEIRETGSDEAIGFPAETTEEDRTRQPGSSLLGMAAHDLRVLVSVIDGYCLLLGETDSNNLSVEQNEIIVGLMSGSRRLVDLANNLLDYSRIEAGRFELNRNRKNLCKIIESVYGDFLPLLQRRGISMQFDCQDREVPVYCDEQGIRRVFYNIVNNALKYTPDGGRIKLELAADENETRVTIEDSGPGIKPELLAGLFDEFRCTPSPDGNPGIGLGLSICKKIIEAHQGQIWAESNPGQGSRFTFCLPN